MSAVPRMPGEVLGQLLADHTARCGVPLRGEHPSTHEGELIYALRCPRCGQVIAHLIVERREPRR
jgi:ribosomal protein S27AE